MFTQMPQGITSGLAPIPRYKMGGMVQYYNGGGETYPNEGLKALAKVRPDVVKKMGYKNGGKTYPNEGLKALAKVAPEVVERMGYEEGGEVFPVDQAMNFVQGTGPMGVPMPSGMPAQVFEEGDDEINAALNNMLAAVKPQGDAPMMDMQEAPTKDQGQDAKQLLEKTTEKFKQAARDFVKEVKDESKGKLTSKQETQVLEGLQEIDRQYKEAVVQIAKSVGDDITEEEVTLLTPDFVEQLDMVSTGEIAMKEPGGIVDVVDSLSQTFDTDFSIEGIRRRLGERLINDASKAVLDRVTDKDEKKDDDEQETPTPKVDSPVGVQDRLQEYLKKPLSTDLMRERMERNRLGTLMSGKSLQGGVAGLVDVAGQAALSESEGMGTIPEREAIVSGDLIKEGFEAATDTPSADKIPAGVKTANYVSDLYRRSQLPPNDPNYLPPQELEFQLESLGIETQGSRRAALIKAFGARLATLDKSELKNFIKQMTNDPNGSLTEAIQKFVDALLIGQAPSIPTTPDPDDDGKV